MKPIAVLIPDADVQLPVACCLAASKQAAVHGLALNSAPLLKHSRFFASFEEYKGQFDAKHWLQWIGNIVSQRRIDVVLPIAEFATKTLSQHRDALDWATKLPPLPSPHALETAADKANLAGFLENAGIAHPPTIVVTGGTVTGAQLATLKYPVLVKPPLSSGGNGIRLFEDPGALLDFFGERASEERWVVQSFIAGRDLGVNVLCHEGRVVAATVQHTIRVSSIPYHYATGIEVRDHPEAMEIAATLMHKLEWSGVANIDMRLPACREDPLVLEINGRYWNSLLGSLNAGVNFPLLACQLRLGASVANTKPHQARYFSGKDAVLLSLVGGGELGIRPLETQLRYFDPLPFAIRLEQSTARLLREGFWQLLANFRNAST
jgi:predicted ATP-grasp superfamily ATP-dependent carboligase